MAAVFTQVNGNAIGTRLLTQQRKRHGVRLDLVTMIERMLAKARLAHCRAVVHIDTKKNVRSGNSHTGCSIWRFHRKSPLEFHISAGK